jgi:hypothetical protein
MISLYVRVVRVRLSNVSNRRASENPKEHHSGAAGGLETATATAKSKSPYDSSRCEQQAAANVRPIFADFYRAAIRTYS